MAIDEYECTFDDIVDVVVLGPDGRTVWEAATDFDSNGILDCFAVEGRPDAVETIARAYVDAGRHREGMVGAARCHLFDAQDIVAFGVGWLERQFGSAPESGEDQT